MFFMYPFLQDALPKQALFCILVDPDHALNDVSLLCDAVIHGLLRIIQIIDIGNDPL